MPPNAAGSTTGAGGTAPVEAAASGAGASLPQLGLGASVPQVGSAAVSHPHFLILGRHFMRSKRPKRGILSPHPQPALALSQPQFGSAAFLSHPQLGAAALSQPESQHYFMQILGRQIFGRLIFGMITGMLRHFTSKLKSLGRQQESPLSQPLSALSAPQFGAAGFAAHPASQARLKNRPRSLPIPSQPQVGSGVAQQEVSQPHPLPPSKRSSNP